MQEQARRSHPAPTHLSRPQPSHGLLRGVALTAAGSPVPADARPGHAGAGRPVPGTKGRPEQWPGVGVRRSRS